MKKYQYYAHFNEFFINKKVQIPSIKHNEDENFFKKFLEYQKKAPHNLIRLASGYMNLSPTLTSLISSSQAKIELLTASPKV